MDDSNLNKSNVTSNSGKESALHFKIIHFHYPEDISCPIQKQGKNS